MNFKAEISRTINEKDWNVQLLKKKESTTYQNTNWSKVYQDSFNSIPIFIRVKNEKDEIVGHLLAKIQQKEYWSDANTILRFIGGTLQLRKMLTWDYGPIFYDVSNQNEILSKILTALDEVAKNYNVTAIRGSSPPLINYGNEKIFQKFNYETKSWSTYIIDLTQNIDHLYQSLDKKTRYDIRKAEQNDLEFEVVKDRSAFDVFQELKIQEKKRRGEKKSRLPKFLDSHWKNLYKNGLENLFLAKHKGEPLSAILCLNFNGNLIQHAVANSGNTDLLGGSFLTWNTIKWSMKKKFLTFDMGGVNPFPKIEKERGIGFYKSKWGGEKTDFIIYLKIRDKTKMKISLALKSPRTVKSKLDSVIKRHRIS